MTRAEAITLWRELTNERNTTSVPDTTVDFYFHAGLETLNRRNKYHYADNTAGITLVNGTQEYSLPTDFVEMVWVEHAGRELKKSSVEHWRSKDRDAWRREDGSEPAEYALYANKIVFRPKPNAAAVATGANPTFRYINTPPDFNTSAFDLLLTQDHRIAVYYAVAEWSFTYPDSAAAFKRGEYYQGRFDQESGMVKEYYEKRSTMRG